MRPLEIALPDGTKFLLTVSEIVKVTPNVNGNGSLVHYAETTEEGLLKRVAEIGKYAGTTLILRERA